MIFGLHFGMHNCIGEFQTPNKSALAPPSFYTIKGELA
jgi:hypothetical protein